MFYFLFFSIYNKNNSKTREVFTMEFLETKKLNRQALLFLAINTLVILNFAIDFYEFH